MRKTPQIAFYAGWNQNAPERDRGQSGGPLQ